MSDLYAAWRDDLVVFLDDGFDCDEAHQYIVEAGFIVQRFRDHFKSDQGGREQNVDDTRVLKLCNSNGWLLATLDHSMKNMHRQTIAECSKVGIIAAAHNSVASAEEWARAFVRLKTTIERNSFKKKLRPWFLHFNKEGRITMGPELITWESDPKDTSSRTVNRRASFRKKAI